MTLSLVAYNKNPRNRGKQYRFLPPENKLPVIVGVRMSLSFPVLFKAVPLWTTNNAVFNRALGSRYELQPKDLQQHLFSDGGIASNFPVHFFDAWLPSHPTFAINLTGLPREAFSRSISSPIEMLSQMLSRTSAQASFLAEQQSKVKEQHFSVIQTTEPSLSPPAAPSGLNGSAPKSDTLANVPVNSAKRTPSLTTAMDDVITLDKPGLEESLTSPHITDAVYLPRASDEIFPAWQQIPHLAGFLGAIISTMMSYRDTTQSMLPGYRERIIHIRLVGDEGGMNLDMPVDTIKLIDQKGAEAGRKLSEFNFDHHQWIRFRVLMAELEVKLKEMRDVLESEEGEVILQAASEMAQIAASQVKTKHRSLYWKLLKQRVDTTYPFVPHQEWPFQAIDRLTDLVKVLQAWGGEEDIFFAKEPPQPKSVIRLTPDL